MYDSGDRTEELNLGVEDNKYVLMRFGSVMETSHKSFGG